MSRVQAPGRNKLRLRVTLPSTGTWSFFSLAIPAGPSFQLPRGSKGNSGWSLTGSSRLDGTQSNRLACVLQIHRGQLQLDTIGPQPARTKAIEPPESAMRPTSLAPVPSSSQGNPEGPRGRLGRERRTS
ncbi:hypothetical protein GQ53DRAFT_244604 [Thozetella sp. PMI_491]|nr:hypothetical protein GQ53DRAFT_244604 [Thozetella sp. PMI_491]